MRPFALLLTLSCLTHSLPPSIHPSLQAWEENNADDYTDHCAEYNAISALDPWKTSLLVKTKRLISAAEQGEEDVDLT